MACLQHFTIESKSCNRAMFLDPLLLLSSTSFKLYLTQCLLHSSLAFALTAGFWKIVLSYSGLQSKNVILASKEDLTYVHCCPLKLMV